jgi:hypothetical protein
MHFWGGDGGNFGGNGGGDGGAGAKRNANNSAVGRALQPPCLSLAFLHCFHSAVSGIPR